MLSTICNGLLHLAELAMPVCYQIINMSITGCYIFVFLFLCRFALKKAPKIYSYVLWLVLLFRLLCPASLPSPVSVLNLLEMQQKKDMVVMEYVSPEIEMADEPAVDLGITSLTKQINQQLPTPTLGASATPMQIQAFFYTNVWLVGMYIFVIYAGISYLRIRRITRTGILLEPGVYECEGLASPFVTGIFHRGNLRKGLFGTGFLQARIYLPCHVTEEEKGIILTHERMHLRRWDPLVKGLYFVALVLHWFNPFVWAAFFLMNRDMEMSCDEAVLQDQEKTKDLSLRDLASAYSSTLLRLASKEAGLVRVSGLRPLAFGESSVSVRIKNALTFRPATFRRKMVLIVVCCAVLAASACNPSAFNPFRLADQNMVDRLWEHRTPYLGDNSAVGNLMTALTVPEELELASQGMVLATDIEPYCLTIRYESGNQDAQGILGKECQWVYENMAILFGLIDNVDLIETQITLVDGSMMYFVGTRWGLTYEIYGDFHYSLQAASKEALKEYIALVQNTDFDTRAVNAPALRHTWLIATIENGAQVQSDTILVSGKHREFFQEDQLFYIRRSSGGLIYDEHGNFLLPAELQPGDKLLVAVHQGELLESLPPQVVSVFVQRIPQ